MARIPSPIHTILQHPLGASLTTRSLKKMSAVRTGWTGLLCVADLPLVAYTAFPIPGGAVRLLGGVLVEVEREEGC
jgi:hypothetical protein